MPKTTTVAIYSIDRAKLKKIKSKYAFPNYAQTVEYVLKKFPEMIEGKEEEFKKHSELLKVSGSGFVQLGQVNKP